MTKEMTVYQTINEDEYIKLYDYLNRIEYSFCQFESPFPVEEKRRLIQKHGSQKN